jgi:tRNA threonylcarbamoyladenosine biosynthesis protein TsaE
MIIKSLENLNSITNKILQEISENDCIFLIGEIGVGKTTFARSFINNLQKKKGVKQTQVLSPTFNLLYEYDINSFKIMHYDLYRIKDVKELKQLGIFKDETSSIKIIEWPELIETNISNRLELHLTYSSKDDERKLNVIGFGKWKNFSKNEF